MLRIVCMSVIEQETGDLTLASQNEDGKWTEFGSVKLRSPFISDWMPAAPGMLHLGIRGNEGFISKCRFTYPADTDRALVILLPDAEKQRYHGDLIVPGKLNFSKGSALVINYSPLQAAVLLGANRGAVKPGGRQVMKPEPEANGMLRRMVAYTDESGKSVPCYDRYVGYSPESRDLLLLLPGATAGSLTVFSLAEFGPFE